ncbi:MAG: carboxymuconolactone decarboxylase family protein [Actinomycetota bacterium]|nr:carboxymuconolactone decarboxylase family protein [Actinomycetota bacterium]
MTNTHTSTALPSGTDSQPNTDVRTFRDHTVATAPEAARPTLHQLQRKFGGLPPALARIAASPELLDAFLAANSFFERCSLSPVQRETLVMTVAVRNGCHVCVEMHSATLRRLRVDHELITALRSGAPVTDPRLAALQAFVHDVMDSAGDVADARFATFMAAGFDQQQALEVVLGIGTYTLSTFANRMTRA